MLIYVLLKRRTNQNECLTTQVSKDENLSVDSKCAYRDMETDIHAQTYKAGLMQIGHPTCVKVIKETTYPRKNPTKSPR